ncbi:MAG: DUF6090 family protein [Robiginitalea sp.]
MFHFFREIRQRLITDKRFSKYLLYAVGEILLVVIGILIALQVNNWNEESKAKRELNTILLEIHKDLNNDLKNLAYRVADFNEFVGNINYLQRNALDLPLDSLANRISDLHQVTAFQAVEFGYNKLNNNPNTDLAPTSLINNLSLYYTTYGKGALNNNTNSEFLSVHSLNLLREFLISYGFPINGPFVDDIENLEVYREIIASAEFWGIVRNMEYNWGIHNYGFQQAERMVTENIQMMESYFEMEKIILPVNSE